VIDRLRGHEKVSLVIERLPLGDYLIDEVLLIERKTLPDLAAPIKDGRLFGQAHRLTGWPRPLWKARSFRKGRRRTWQDPGCAARPFRAL